MNLDNITELDDYFLGKYGSELRIKDGIIQLKGIRIMEASWSGIFQKAESYIEEFINQNTKQKLLIVLKTDWLASSSTVSIRTLLEKISLTEKKELVEVHWYYSGNKEIDTEDLIEGFIEFINLKFTVFKVSEEELRVK